MSKLHCFLFVIIIASCFHISGFSQSLSINTDGSSANASAMLDIKSTTKGLLIPRMSTLQRTAIAGPATGLQVYDTDLNQFFYYSGGWNVFGTYNFSTGLTNNAGTITNNLSTGFSGGQNVVGGTSLGENLTLFSTSNLTKGKILFGTSAYDEANNRLGIGTVSPFYGLEVKGTTDLATALFQNPTSGTGKTRVVIKSGAGNNTNIADAVLSIQNSSGGQVAYVRTDGFTAGYYLGSYDDYTAAIVDGTKGNVFYPRGLNLGSTSIIGWSYADWFNAKDIGFSRGAAGKLYLGNGQQGDFTGTLIAGSIGIGTVSPALSSLLDVSSTTKGFLPPRMTTLQRTGISSPAEGLMVFDSDLKKLYVFDGTVWQAAW